MIRNLATLDRDIGQALGRIIQEAFADGLVVNKQYSGGGLIANGVDQDIDVESQTQNFEIGTRLVIDDRVFRYCKAGDTLRSMLEGLNAGVPTECNTHGVESAAGSDEVTILDETARVVDYYKGGYIWIMKIPHEATGLGQFYRIKSSTVNDPGGGGTFVTLTLERTLAFAVPATTWTTTWTNIYGNVRPGILAKASLVCMPLIPVTSGYYFWGQTWGPIFLQCGYSPGSKNYDREFYYKSDHYGVLPGSEIDFSSLGNVIPQRIGFLLVNTVNGTDNFMMLQLSP